MKRHRKIIFSLISLLLGIALWLQSPYLRRTQAAGNAWTSKTGMNTGRSSLAATEINGKLYAVGGVTILYLNTLEVYDPATDIWTTKAPMPTARFGLAAAEINGKLYAVGGDKDHNPVNTLEVYDPATDTWTTKAPMPTAREFLAAAAINGKLYAVGGNNGNDLNTLEVYDPATDTWTSKAPMPTGRGSLAAAAINGKLYAVGGNNGNDLNTLEVYDPATDTWMSKAPMPTAREFLAAAAINGKLYAVGGNRPGGAVNTLEVYDPATDTWTSKQPMPTKRARLAAAAINGQLYAVGGDVLKTLEVYTTPEPNAWASRTPLTTARQGLGAIEINGQLYVVGGFTGSEFLQTLDGYNAATDAWETKNPMPTARFELAAAELNGKLYVVGGSIGHSVNTLEVYDPVTDIWETKTPMPTARQALAAAPINGKLYVVGGRSSGTYFDKLEVYDPVTDTWETKTPMPTARGDLAAAEIDGKLYVIGGSNLSFLNTLEVYDPATDTWDTSQTNMPTVRRGAAAAAINGKLYVVGGTNGAGYFNTLEVYSPATDHWTSKQGMPTGRAFLAAAEVNGKFFAVGGANNGGRLRRVEDFQVASDLTLDKSHSGEFIFGMDGSYTLTVNNKASANCTEGPITVTDTLPSGLSFASANGTGWSCTANGQSVTCTNSSLTLDAGASNSFTLSVHTTAPGNVTNYASVATTDEIITNNNAANSGNGDPTMINCPTITTTLSGAIEICPGTSATLKVDITGGTAPYTVKLSDGQQKTSSTLPITFMVSPTATTDYAVQLLSDNYPCAPPPSNSVTVTVTKPDTIITAAPPAISDNNASFSFRRNDNCSSVVTFECQLDNGGFSACASPKAYTNLTGGSHTFAVRTRDTYGNVDATPATYTWTVFTNTCGTVVNPAVLPAATRGAPFVQTFSAAPIGSYVFSVVAGPLPPGITLVNTLGVYSLRGTPTTAGTYQFTIKAVKANSTCAAVRTYTMVIP